MAWPLRIQFPGALCHLMSRGNERQPIVRDGTGEPPRSPFADAMGGLLVGSTSLIERVRKLLDDRPPDTAVPQLKTVCRRPPLQEIAALMAAHFGNNPSRRTVPVIGTLAAAYAEAGRFSEAV